MKLSAQLAVAVAEGMSWSSLGLERYAIQTVIGQASVIKGPGGWVVTLGDTKVSLGDELDLGKAEKAIHGVLASTKIPGIPDFKTVADIEAWKVSQIKAFGSKSKFISSPLYGAAYPRIKAVYDAETKAHKAKSGAAGEAAMAEVGLGYGDRVQYTAQHSFGSTTVRGKLIKRGGIPTVELDPASREMTFGNNRYVQWDRGWKSSI